MNRTAGTIIREMAQAKAAPIDDDVKQAILAELSGELRSIYLLKAKQQNLPLEPEPKPPAKR